LTTNDALTIYTDGSCLGNPGPGGWGAIVFDGTGDAQQLSGHEAHTTNNRMELMAAIQGLEAAPVGSKVVLYSDSGYLVNTMTKNWKRRVNHDLWGQLDALSGSRSVEWRWVRGHNGDRWNEAADRLAGSAMKLAADGKFDEEYDGEAGPMSSGPKSNEESSSPQGDIFESNKPADSLTHLDDEGRAKMVDVGAKPITDREATARGHVSVLPDTLRLIKEGLMKKGDVLTIAQLAGIMGAKQTSNLIPLCHPLPINKINVELQLDEEHQRIEISATVSTSAKTGVEMEALTAVSIAALTVYDMVKAVDRGVRIEAIRLVRKTGGQSGDINLED